MYFLVGGESGNFSYAIANKVMELLEIDHLDDFLS